MNLDIAMSILLTFSAACYLLLGIRLIVAKREVGSVPIGVLFVIISFWVMGGAVELMSESFLVFSIGRTGHFIGTALLPLAAFVCFREYTGTSTPLRTIILLLIVPGILLALAWSMDKIGPICRSIEDCALVFDAIHGADGKVPVAGRQGLVGQGAAQLLDLLLDVGRVGEQPVHGDQHHQRGDEGQEGVGQTRSPAESAGPRHHWCTVHRRHTPATRSLLHPGAVIVVFPTSVR